MKCIAFTRPDGGVSIVHPVPGFIAELQHGGLSEDRAAALCSWFRRPEQFDLTHEYKQRTIEQLTGDGLTTEDAITFILRRDVPRDAKNIEIIEQTSLPKTRRFRNAWRQTGGAVTVSMPLAYDQRMNEIRVERDARLKATDGAFMRAIELDGPELATLKKTRQALRDMPQTIDLSAMKTPEELEQFQPTWPK